MGNVREQDLEAKIVVLRSRNESECPILKHGDHVMDGSASSEETNRSRSSEEWKREKELDHEPGSCGWIKASALLFGEYVGICTMSFPRAYSTLGIVPALAVTMGICATVTYISFLTWQFCMKHPQVKNICDLASALFEGNTWIWWITAIFFLAENTFLQALHIVVGAKFLATVTGRGICEVILAVTVVAACWLGSITRTFNALSRIALVVSVSTIASVLAVIAFAAVQSHDPNQLPHKTSSTVLLILPKSGTTLTTGMSAVLNIFYALLTQTSVPSIVAEMKRPQEFPKALALATGCQIVIFCTFGSAVYAFLPTEDIAPMVLDNLRHPFKIAGYCMMFPTIMFMGVFHSSLSGRLIHFEMSTKHKPWRRHGIYGWVSWIGVLGALWTVAFLISEVIPFFSDLLSLMTSLFQPYLGFWLWVAVYVKIRWQRLRRGSWRENCLSLAETLVNLSLVLVGGFLLVCGTYVSIRSIANKYERNDMVAAFSCRSNEA